MKGFLAVFRREVFEHRLVFAAAAAAGLLALAAPLLPAARGHSPAEVRASVALFLALLFAAGVSILLGALILARDLFEGRLSFYFSRPLSSFSLWAGKTLGAAAVSGATVPLLLLPAILAGADFRSWQDWSDDSGPLLWAGLAGAILLLVAVSHAAAVVLRSRSPLLLLDAVLLVILVMVGAAVARPLLSISALGPIGVVTGLAASAAALGILAGGAAQVIAGRVDPRRGRIALSAGFWSAALAGIVACAGYAAWVLAAGPEDLSLRHVVPAARGSWVAVTGRAEGRGDYRPTFLFDTARESFVRAGADAVFSPDGKIAVWMEVASLRKRSPGDLFFARLDRPEPSSVETGISASAWNPLVLSQDGKRVASPGQTISIFDLSSGRLLGAARAGTPARISKAFFVSPNLLRVWRQLSTPSSGETATIEILEFDIPAKKLARTGSIRLAESVWPVLADPDGDRLLIRSGGGSKTIALYDGRTGALLSTLAEQARGERAWADFASDGRIVLGQSQNGAATLRIFSKDGLLLSEIPLGAGSRVVLGGEAAAGKLVVAAGPEGMRSELTGRIFVADLALGTARPVAEKLFPVASFQRWFGGDPTLAPEPGSEATKLFYGPNGSLVRFDPLTGERRVVLAGKG